MTCSIKWLQFDTVVYLSYVGQINPKYIPPFTRGLTCVKDEAAVSDYIFSKPHRSRYAAPAMDTQSSRTDGAHESYAQPLHSCPSLTSANNRDDFKQTGDIWRTI